MGFGADEEFNLKYFILYQSREVSGQWEEGMTGSYDSTQLSISFINSLPNISHFWSLGILGWGFQFNVGSICYFPGICARTLIDIQYADNDAIGRCDVFRELYQQLPKGKVVAIRGTIVRPQVAGIFRFPGQASVRLALSTNSFAFISQTSCTVVLFGVSVDTTFATGSLPQPFLRTNFRVYKKLFSAKHFVCVTFET